MILASLALRFIVELGGVAAAGYAGYQAVGGGARGAVVGVAAAAALVTVWGLALAPTAANGLTRTTRTTLGTAVLVLAALALATTGQPGLGIGFGAVVIANAAFLLAFPARVDAALASGRGAGR